MQIDLSAWLFCSTEIMIKLFITGTDTEVGKTYISREILTSLNQLGYSTLAIKPIASGCKKINNKLYSEDTIILQKAASIKLTHDEITPFAFEPAIAPHIAAQQIQSELSVSQLRIALKSTLEIKTDACIIEGCGGWHTPLNASETMADFVVSQNLPVLLVVGIRLGCINHALLTHQALQRSGIRTVGWIANCINKHMLFIDDNIAYLQQQFPYPCLDIIRYGMPLKLTSVQSLLLHNRRIAR